MKKILPFPELHYAKGDAVGESDIRLDAVFFRFKDEMFIVPTLYACKIWDKRGGTWIFAKISKIRKLEKMGMAKRYTPEFKEE